MTYLLMLLGIGGDISGGGGDPGAGVGNLIMPNSDNLLLPNGDVLLLPSG